MAQQIAQEIEEIGKKEGDYKEIEFKFGKLIVDADIYYRIVQDEKPRPYHKYKRLKYFRYHGSGVKCSIGGSKRYTLSRLILQPAKNKIVDHINRNPLDNRRVNLRIVNARQNCLNTIRKNSSGYIGVCVYLNKKKLYCEAAFKTEAGKHLKFCITDSPKNRIICALMRDKFILQNGDEQYAPLNFPKLKNEPLKTIFLRKKPYKNKKTQRV